MGLKEPKNRPIFIDYQCVGCDWLIGSTKIASASFRRRLRVYPATWIEMGSPKGAIFSTLISSPGTHPISSSFKKRSESSIEWMIADSPGLKSLSFIIEYKSSFVGWLLITNFGNA